MSYTIIGAAYATHDHTAAVILTEEAGPVAISVGDTPQEWGALHQSGVPIEDFVPGPASIAPARPELAAQAQLAVNDDEIAGIETSVGLGAAMVLDVGLFWLFFSEPQPDTNYLPIVQAPGFNADVTYPLNADFLEITVTDRATGAAAVPTQLIVSIQRVR